MITPRMGTAPVAQLRRTISSTQVYALNILRQLRSTRPPPQLPPHQEDADPTVVVPPEKDPEKK